LLAFADLAMASGDRMIGRVLDGRFTIVARVGAGSMGAVYRAKQHAIGREVAIKILRSDRAVDDSSKARFLREARANSVLVSPHTVRVYDFGETQNHELYLAMELLEGESVGQRLAKTKRFTAQEAVETTRQALRSLAEAHAKGIVHRDLKPDNLFYAKVPNASGTGFEEIVKVLDFGIAKMTGPSESGPMSPIETQAGTVFGTPRFMSPEQAQGKPLDARSDLYSLAVILYQMLTGKPPFTDNDAIVVMARHIKTPPAPPSEAFPDARVPTELEAVLMRALAKDPAARPASAEAFSLELARALESCYPMSGTARLVFEKTTAMPQSLMPTAESTDPGASGPRNAPIAESRGRSVRVALAAAVSGIGLVAMLFFAFFGRPPASPALPPATGAAAPVLDGARVIPGEVGASPRVNMPGAAEPSLPFVDGTTRSAGELDSEPKPPATARSVEEPPSAATVTVRPTTQSVELPRAQRPAVIPPAPAPAPAPGPAAPQPARRATPRATSGNANANASNPAGSPYERWE
jgi:serine/threonine-protein kinase